ncbi:S-adenosyl-L-methionine-dependent methyltransferase [Ascobolus immersus RN42]|uniref:S-adenosyl-L-methionine-dependent methyltransferase n=1 Tax=Ascobolus immersus RN42 TaxID=1160509 RepID=A0A3N4IC94_ASCIM|nr:S-adenosyl-L-methionine-dependent methyltransferase [Ascobolus immersus RN42]
MSIEQTTVPELENQQESRIEILNEDDSDYAASTIDSDTTSITSSVLDYVYENGRRYPSRRSQVEALLPNDEDEQERLDLLHHYHLLVLKGALFLAPVKDLAGKRILDLGTGTGIWAIDVADQYPEAQVLGVDISPIQPNFVPPNARFEIDNIEDDWTYSSKFSLIHTRSLMGSVKDWPALIKRAFDHLEPGGWLDLHETHTTGAYSEDGTTKGTAIEEYNEALKEAGLKSGHRLDLAPQLEAFLKEAGFVDVKVDKFRAPVGAWPKNPTMRQLGVIGMESVKTGSEAYGLLAFTKILGWDVDRAKKVIRETVEACMNKKVHLIYPIYNVVGRKPFESEAAGNVAEA